MKSDPMSKLSAGFFVLVMVLSAVMIVPAGGQGQTTGTTNIYVPVLSGGLPVTNAYVNLTEVHTGAVIAAQYSSTWTAYVAANAPSGYYRVDVVHKDYYDQLDAEEFRYEGSTNYTADIVYLTAFPSKIYTWNITVRNPSNQIVPGATVGFYDPIAKEWVAQGVTNSLGYVAVDMFPTSVLGDVDLVVVASGFETYVQPVLVSGNNVLTVNLAASMVVSSYVKLGTDPARNVVSYLINTDSSVVWVKRVLKSMSSAMRFDAYAGNFILVVDADSAAAHVQALTVSTSNIDLSITLNSQTQRTEDITLTYGGTNFSAFALNVDTNWSYDEAYPGLMFNDMGSLRVQVDLVLGNGDGTLDPSEVQAFYDKLYTWGTEYVTSDRLLTVNSTAYISDLNVDSATFIMNLATGSDIDITPVRYRYDCGYNATGIDVGSPVYSAVATVYYDTYEVSYVYSIALVAGYERVSNSSGSYAITGYKTIVIEPMQVSGGSVAIALGFEKSLEPVARAGVESSAYAYILKNSTGSVLEYIVRVGRNITFTSADSSDPNGNPLTYSWDFGDGSPVVPITNDTVVHNYTSAGNRTVSLLVEDVVGIQDTVDIQVVCDNLNPVPLITVVQGWINQTDGAIWVDQAGVVIVTAANESYDDAVTVGDHQGLIDWVQFDYGDNESSARISRTASQQNVTHIYKKAGVFNLTLTVTDVVGHNSTSKMVVHVNDTTKPTVSFTAKNATGGTTLTENTTVVFNASATTDNLDNITDLYFSWYFGDGTWLNGTGAEGFDVVNHTYQRIGQLTMNVNVTDLAGNWNKVPKVITLSQGPRPKIVIDRIYYEPGNFTADKSGYIIVNMTNKGNAVAKNIVVTFYILNDDGSQTLLGTWTEVLNASTGQPVDNTVGVSIGGEIQVKFPWTFGNKGTYSMKVNVTCTDQLYPGTYTASGSQALTVKEAAWVQYALWGGVLAVIVLVPALLYLRSRWSKREKKGPRRERKPEEEE